MQRNPILAFLGATLIWSSCQAPSASSSVQHPNVELSSQPMVGHVSMRGVNLWAQTTSPNVELVATILSAKGDTMVSQADAISHPVFRTVTFDLGGLEPGTSYKCLISAEGQNIADTLNFETQPLWDFRTEPPAFQVLTGSCKAGGSVRLSSAYWQLRLCQ